ncbi:Sec1-like family protein [Tieghemostelium lacteum]|uniref:Sec1-like family protein n=1 Tax=Tieghemostelium lacteum TaxID=361077 RepID=A0A151ZIG6_TIELA|nr:Sec1-like family protein [Tieghemostelium lacteum]|eukprot:KYQ93788.1 Sec1-like family protein [Tieghemostelium lacteum]
MDVIASIREYINKMLEGIKGMKVLVLDKETAGIVSMVYTQSEILQKEVFLFEKIDTENREKMHHMKGVYFARPTQDNINYITDELKEPKYNGYHLFFTNILSGIHLDEIAKADEQDVVVEVQEFFGDYFAVNTELFTLNIPGLLSKRSTAWTHNQNRVVDGILAAVLSLKQKPIIRYSFNSETTKYLAEKLADRFNREKTLFDFRKKNESLLLILDRKDDPVTPLLHQWTYQAMVHELCGGIHNNRVTLPSKAKNPDADIILSPEHDSFYKDNLRQNFGELGVKIKELVDQYQDRYNTTSGKIKTIDDMKKFIENYPNFQKSSSTASKHVSLMDEMSNIITRDSLMPVSEVQQELACNDNHNAVLQTMSHLFKDEDSNGGHLNVTTRDKLVMAIIYCLRYEAKSWDMKQTLSSIGFSSTDISMIDQILMYAGSTQREGQLFGSSNFYQAAIQVVERGLKGVENIFCQHKPLLHGILESFAVNKLSDKSYPYLTNSRDRPTDIIIFICGGATYEEAVTINNFNNKYNGQFRAVLGGTTILNTKQFLQDIENLKK